MGTVTQYNFSNIQSALGGANPISINEYYRGGPYVPTTRSTTTNTRNPPTGNLSPFNSPPYNFWEVGYTSSTGPSGVTGYNSFYRNNVSTNLSFLGYVTLSSYTSGNTTTYRSSYFSGYEDTGNYFSQWRIYEVVTSTSTVSINTGVPSSGQISISQLYGAENP